MLIAATGMLASVLVQEPHPILTLTGRRVTLKWRFYDVLWEGVRFIDRRLVDRREEISDE